MRRSIFKTKQLLLILLVGLLSACRPGVKDSEMHPVSKDSAPLPGRFVSWDSVPPPSVQKVPQPIVTPAHTESRIAHQGNELPLVQPRIYAAKPAVVQTPGKDGFLLPEKVRATPKIKEMQLPEQINLTAPISRDNNPFGFLVYTKTQGLPHDFVSCFYQDPEGDMWVGTLGGGLMRFNGTSIESYNKNQGFNINDVVEITGDGKGNIWMTTLEGLYKLNGHRIFRYDYESGNLRHNALHSLQIDPSGNLWFSYRHGGVGMFDGEYFYHYGPEQGLPDAQRHILRAAPNGDVWISLFDKGLALFRDGSFHLLEVPHVALSNFISTLTVVGNEKIWLGIYDKGAMHFDGQNFHFHDASAGFPFPRINRIKIDAKGRTWFGTWGGGIVMMDGDKYVRFTTEHGLANDFITFLYPDNRGVMWIAFHNGGLTRYLGEVFRHYSISQAVDHNIISLAHTPDSKLWLSTFEEGILSFDGHEFVQYSNRPDGPIRYMEGAYADAAGHLWMSVDDGGITRFDGKNFYTYPLEDMQGRWFIHGGLSDDQGNLWLIPGEQGLVKYDGTDFTFYTKEQGLPSLHSTHIIRDRHGNLWVGTWGDGVYSVNSEGVRSISTRDGLAGNYVYALFEDSQGNMWFGTEGNGVSMFNGRQFVNFTSRNGLTDNYILAIEEDKAGNMIFGGRFGVSMMPRQTLLRISQSRFGTGAELSREGEGILFLTHTYVDGFLGMGTNQKAMLREGEKIWIGANDRLTTFFPEQSWYDTLAPRVRLTQVDLFNETLNWALMQGPALSQQLAAFPGIDGKIRFDSLSPWHQLPHRLRLGNRNNYLSFRFSGVSPNNRKLLYSFMLEGADQHWHRPTSSNVAHYGNLAPGSYTFRVRAYTALGQGGPVFEYPFVILSPWYSTWRAWTIYVLLAAIILHAFFKMRFRSLVLKNQILDNQVELARKSVEIKQNIIANVSHELRTPLTGIIGLTDLLEDTPLTKTQRDYIGTLRQTSRNLREIINQILDYSKIESGQVSLIKVSFSLHELFNHARDVFDSLRQDKQLLLETHIEPEAGKIIYADRGRINQVLQNLYYNAVKFTPEGKISLHAGVIDRKPAIDDNGRACEELTLKITVTDTGTGIPEEDVNKLFVPFSQIEIKDTRPSDSTGLGLAISRKLAEMMQGRIGLESKVGEGSCFWFTFKALHGLQSADDDAADIADSRAAETAPLRLLLVEDKKVNQMVIRLILEKMGHTVTLAEHGQQALDIYVPGKFDLIFMDIQMPVMDGIAATRELRERYPVLPPIVGLSANAFEGDREKYISQGMDDYITKPVSANSLRRVIAGVCR